MANYSITTAYLKKKGSFEARINRESSFSFRSRRLNAVVEAINNYVAGPNRDQLRTIERRWEEWRKEDPKEYADRGKPLEADLRAEMLQGSAKELEIYKAIWIPGPPNAPGGPPGPPGPQGVELVGLDRLARNFVRTAPNMKQDVVHSGQRGLADLHPQSKLYILAHGHDHMPLFCNDNGTKWTASQIAGMLRDDGLSLEHREIELLVCNAGESVNTKSGSHAMMKLRSDVNWAKQRNDQAKVEQLNEEYKALAERAPAPQPFERDPERLLLPLAAQLAADLRRRGFTHFQLISYKCPVAQYVDPGGGVYLDLTSKGGSFAVPVATNLQYRVVWR
jgi:hypothetical protein